MRSQRTVVGAEALLAAIILSSCGLGSGTDTPSSGDGIVQEFEPGERVQLPAFDGQTLGGSAFSSTEALGSILVINVWGSWCIPCRGEAPDLERASRDTADQGVRFLGINVRDNDSAARAFERQYSVSYPSIDTDTSSGAVLALSAAAPSNAVPATVILDTQGQVAARVIGATTYSTLMALIDPLTAEAGAASTP